jgi:hypothetical protein
MSKPKQKVQVDTTPNCTVVKYPGLPRKVIPTTVREVAIQRYKEDYRLSYLRPDEMFTTELVYEMEREVR